MAPNYVEGPAPSLFLPAVFNILGWRHRPIFPICHSTSAFLGSRGTEQSLIEGLFDCGFAVVGQVEKVGALKEARDAI